MELFENGIFFIGLIIFSLPAIFLGLREKKIKGYGIFVTLIFLATTLYNKPSQLIYMSVFLIYEFLMVKLFLLINKKGHKGEKGYFAFLFLSLLPLLAYKLLALKGYSIFAFIGISYMTFKCLQYIIEIKDGLIGEVSLVDFFYINIFFPSIVSGPIDRSRRFNKDVNEAKSRGEYLTLLSSGLEKLLVGAFYKFVISQLIYPYLQSLAQTEEKLALLAYMYLYGFYLFFDFAGYSKMAVGAANIFGISLPNNFNKPFISKDIKEFWDRWHISLSYWFRDFVFSRLIMRMIRQGWFKNKLTRASIAFIINMLIMGLWHGLAINYIAYGLYHGLLLAATELYQKKSKFHKKNKGRVFYKTISCFLTFHLVMIGFLIFSGRLNYLI